MNYRHGLSHLPEYKVWASMKGRCTSPSNAAYKNYGGRGIGVSERWLTFPEFIQDMGPRPSPSHTLERVENDKGYSAGNCIWATRVTQGRNKRSNHVISIDGVSKTISAWVEHFGVVSAHTARQRIHKGWSGEQAVSTPPVARRKCIPRGSQIGTSAEPDINGVPLSSLISASALPHKLVLARLRRGWPLQDALNCAPRKGRRMFGAKNGVVFNEPEKAAA